MKLHLNEPEVREAIAAVLGEFFDMEFEVQELPTDIRHVDFVSGDDYRFVFPCSFGEGTIASLEKDLRSKLKQQTNMFQLHKIHNLTSRFVIQDSSQWMSEYHSK